MTRTVHLLLAASLLLLAPAVSRAQTPGDPSSHWEGSVDLQGNPLQFGVDFTRDAAGQLSGTIEIPSQQLKGLPLLKVAVDGKAITFSARRDQTMTGNFSDDGAAISGAFAVEGTAMPFSLKRTGEAHVEPPLKSSPIGKELEGTWAATMASSGMHVELRLVNQPGGAKGHIVNMDQGELEIPVALTQTASSVTFETKVIAGSFAGALNSDASELAGKWTQGSVSVPLTFKRASGK